MRTKNEISGHLFALTAILVWGTTFTSTKILLKSFAPVEILFFRFIIGFTVLFILSPRKISVKNMRQELIFAAAGFCGITMYFLMENIALLHTTASNAGVIVSLSPFFTGILSFYFSDDEKPDVSFFIGFVIALTGIGLISFNGMMNLNLNPIGDFLALLAAFFWSLYSILMKKVSKFGYSNLESTKRVFFYGLFFMIPAILISDFKWEFIRFADPVNLFNILFLGAGASALCFAAWNTAVNILGAVKTSVYIYIVPIVTVLSAALVLGEKLTIISVCGVIITFAGLLISENKINFKKIRYLGKAEE